MKEFKSVNDILEFAIKAEQEAVDLYNGLSNRARNQQMKKVFLEFAEEEMRHKLKLSNIRDGGSIDLPGERIRDLRISDYLVDVSPSPDMTYSDALILAMKNEKNAFRLYTMLQNEVSDPALKNLFLNLAQEESRHKLRFELEYDEYVLKEN